MNALVEMQSKVLDLALHMRQMPQLEIQIVHHFSPGIYGREMIVPKGAVIVGKKHRRAHTCVILEGDFSFTTDEGIERKKAGTVWLSPAGTKRAIYAHENGRWIVFHGTEETDLEKIEKLFIVEEE